MKHFYLIGIFVTILFGIANTAHAIFFGDLKLSMLAQVFQPQLTLAVEKRESLSITINGYTGPITAGVKRLLWDWGDGVHDEGWFPRSHQYSQAGAYKIQVTAEGLFGNTSKELGITVTSVIQEKKKPTLQLGALFIQNLTVTINGYVQRAERLVWNWGDGSVEEERWFPASHTYSQQGVYKVVVTAKAGEQASKKTLLVAVPSKNSEVVTLVGQYSGFYDFPKQFFDESVVQAEQILRVTDAQYQSLKKMHNDITPYSFTKITYEPSVNGATTPNGIKLGDAAFPALNEGNPRWEVMAHEQGHNFFGGMSGWYYALAVPGPFLQESFAVLSAFYTYHDAVLRQQEFQLDSGTIESLNYDFSNGRAYQESQYNLYVSQGSPFRNTNVLTSQALDYKMIVYGETYGWENYTKFAKAFENGIASQFTFQNDGVSVTEQSTYAIAVLGVAFSKDFRGEFRALNFPIDDVLYGEVYPKISTYVLGKNVTPPPPPTGGGVGGGPAPVPVPSPAGSKEIKVPMPRIENVIERLQSVLNKLFNLLK